MDRLTAMEAFVRVVEKGGFTAAAEDFATLTRHGQQARSRFGGASRRTTAEPDDAQAQSH